MSSPERKTESQEALRRDAAVGCSPRRPLLTLVLGPEKAGRGPAKLSAYPRHIGGCCAPALYLITLVARIKLRVADAEIDAIRAVSRGLNAGSSLATLGG